MSASIKVGCRESPLSQAQFRELAKMIPNLTPYLVETIGDRDQKTSLRTMDKTDFFTRCIDEAQLEGKCRLSLHSAKDLPDPLPKGLVLAALTKGVDPRDSLVMRKGEQLKPGARVGTSSERRDAMVRRLCPDITPVDIRGNIGQRLQLLFSGMVDAVVIAEAALVRLGLTHLNRIIFPDKTAPLQGQLAVLAREEDMEMRFLCAPIDSRPMHRVMYLGIDSCDLHYPIIRTVPRKVALPPHTHIIFTSKMAVRHFPGSLVGKTIIAVGKKTGEEARAHHIAEEETAEGVCALLDQLDLEGATILWPHSALSRPVISDYLSERDIAFHDTVLYDTVTNRPFDPPNLDPIDEIVFTSPSTVKAFLELYGELPTNKKLTAQGPITQGALNASYPAQTGIA